MRELLIVDDDKELAGITKDMLDSYGYHVELSYTVEEAYEKLEKNQYHLILLDINLTDGTGFEVCKELREYSKVPVIFISARTNEDDKIKGLDIGADDYIEKPYSLKEMLARVKALIRRTYGEEEEGASYSFGTVTVNTGTRKVTKDGQEVKLALKEFDLLEYLLKNQEKILKKEIILKDVWGAFSETEISTVAVHIRWLREKLEENPSHPKWIRTVWGIGYIFGEEDA